MSNSETNLIIAGIFGFGAVISALISSSYSSDKKFVTSAKVLDQNLDQVESIAVRYAYITPHTTSPIKTEHSRHEWLHLKTDKYDVYSTTNTSNTGSFVTSSTNSEEEHRGCSVQSSNLEPHDTTNIQNLLPMLANKYTMYENKIFKPSSTQPGSTYNVSFNITDTIRATLKNRTYIGKSYYNKGLPNNMAKYLIIARHDGSQFITDQKIIIEKGKTIDEVGAELESGKKMTRVVQSASDY